MNNNENLDQIFNEIEQEESYFNVLNEHVNFVNEAYFGKTPQLLELENAIGELRESYSFMRDYTATPEIKRIEDAVIEQFNMEYFSLNIIPQNIPNAFTYPIGTRFDIVKSDRLSDYVIADQKNGYKFKKGNGFVIITAIYGGVLANPNFTNAEVVAILLHEIGHNFADVISEDVKLANYEFFEQYWILVILRAILSKGATLIQDIIFGVTNTNAYQKMEKKLERNGGRIYGFLQGVSGKINDFYFNTNLFIDRLLKGAFYSILGQKYIMSKKKSTQGYNNNGKSGIKSAAGRQNEVIADKFAAIYGYGPEQVSALAKLESTTYPADNILRALPFGEVLYKYNKMASMDYFKKDVHPNIIQRCNSMIESLEFELKKKNLDPKMRKIIQQQLKEMQEVKAEYMKILDNDNDVQIILKTYAAVIDEKMPEATTKELEKEINKQIDDLCNKKYK